MSFAADIREPSEDRQWLGRLVGAVLPMFGGSSSGPEGVAVLGSIAEGFGNDCSDVDLLVLTEQGAGRSQVRQMTNFEDRRVEVFLRAAAELLEFERSVRSSPHPSSDDLSLYHQVAYAFPVVDRPFFRDLRASFDRAWLAETRARIARCEARASFAKGLLALRCGRARDAAIYARTSLRTAAVAHVCERGETYRPLKFLLRQLERCGTPRARITRYQDTMDRVYEEENPSARMEDVRAVAADLGIHFDLPPRWILELREDASVATIGEHLVVSRGSQSAVLEAPPAELAELLRGEVELEAATSDGVVETLGFLHRAGMLVARQADLVWCDDRPLAVGALRITSTGLATSAPRLMVPHSVDSILQSGLRLVSSAFSIENLEEDVAGAIRRCDWGAVSHSFHRIACHYGVIALCHELACSPPEDEAVLEALAQHPSMSELTVLVDRMFACTVRGPAQALQAYDVSREIAAQMRRGVISRHIKGCHRSGVGWAKLVMYVLGPWAEVIRDREMPASEELVHGIEYGMRRGSELTNRATEEALRWTSPIVFEAEIARLRSAATARCSEAIPVRDVGT